MKVPKVNIIICPDCGKILDLYRCLALDSQKHELINFVDLVPCYECSTQGFYHEST